MTQTLHDILGPDGAIARRLGDKFEHRPQQLEMASAVEDAFSSGHHLLVEAGTGVGKSFAYLLPAIEFAVKHKKRVVISTHTISLQEQLIDKDIPLIQSVYPDEFTAVLVKGRSNYLCRRRLQQAQTRQHYLFENNRQLESLFAVEQWANETSDGSLADLPAVPDREVWDKVCAEHGNCLGKKCAFYEHCFWQSAKRRMQSGNILIVNHALFFSDLALRMAGVNYLPKHDLLILDEAHTIEDVAGDHFGLKITEGGLRYQLRALYDVKRGRGMLSTHGSGANDAIRDIVELHQRIEAFFERCIAWQQSAGRSNGRIRESNWVDNDLSPTLRDLAKHIKAMLPALKDDGEISELTAQAARAEASAAALDAIISQSVPDAVYWIEVAGKAPRRVSLHAAPIDVAQGLRTYLFDKMHSVILTSATLCTRASSKPPQQRDTTRRSMSGTNLEAPDLQRGTGRRPVSGDLKIRQGAYLPHWTRDGGIYAVTFRLGDSLPKAVLDEWRDRREHLANVAKTQYREPLPQELRELQAYFSDRVEQALDAGAGNCWMRNPQIASIVAETLAHFDGQRFHLLAWCIMPNHVHAVLQPIDGFQLSDILHAWKTHSALAANRLLHRHGEFWQPESYDHLIRDEDDLRNQVKYAFENPDRAELENWKWRGINEKTMNDILDGSPAAPEHGPAARATNSTNSSSMPTGACDSAAFDYIRSRLGVTRDKTLQLGSPFDYEKQATLYIEESLPDPSDASRFLPAACEKILKYLQLTQGGAFVLFTSYKMLADAANRLKPALDELGLPILVQGQQAPRKILLDRFRSTHNAVLFGTASFWQGIDVQGDTLRNVIIVKLPFAVPDEPVVEARLEAIERRGGNAFMEYSVPQAVIKLKQGFGRLIRSKVDRGIVVLLDHRITTKRYGKIFLDSLPPCRRVIVQKTGNEGEGLGTKD